MTDPRGITMGRRPLGPFRMACPASLLIALLVLVGTLYGLRPALAQQDRSMPPAVCRIGVNVEDLYDLDMARDSFGAALWVWVLCPTPEADPLPTLAFSTAAPGLGLGPIEIVDLPT